MANVSFKIGDKEYVFKPGMFSEFVSIAYPDVAPERTSKAAGTYDFGGDPINLPPPATTATQDVVVQTQPQQRLPVSEPVFDFAPGQSVQQVVESSAGAAEAAGETGTQAPPPPPTEQTVPTEVGTYYYYDAEGNVNGPVTLAVYNQKIGEGFYGYDPTTGGGGGETEPPPGSGGGGGGVIPPPSQSPAGTGDTGKKVTEDDIKAELKKKYTWLDPKLVEMFYDEWIEQGRPDDTTDVLNTIRNTNYHKEKFKGFLREDGSTRFNSELDYVQQIEQYKIDLAGYGLNPDIFQDDFVDAIINDVSPAKFQQNLDFIYPVLQRLAPVVRQNFGQQLGLSQEDTDTLDDNVIISALISKNVNQRFLQRELDVAEIRNVGAEFGGIGVEAAGRLAAQGVTGQTAVSIGKSLGARFGRLQSLAQRTLGSPDVFGLVDFVEAQVFQGSAGDVLLDKLEAAQRTEFSAAERSAITEEGVTGLLER